MSWTAKDSEIHMDCMAFGMGCCCLQARLDPPAPTAIFVLMAGLRTKILDFRGFDSSIILILGAGILMSKGNYPEDLSQQVLVGMILVGRLGVIFQICLDFEQHVSKSDLRPLVKGPPTDSRFVQTLD